MPSKSRYKKASSKIAKRRKARKFAGIFLKVSIPVVLIIGIIFLARADFLKVRNFEVVGAETIPAESIKDVAANLTLGTKYLVIPKSNIFVFNKEKLASALLSQFTRLEKVEVNKQFFTKNIELKITERKGEFLWCSNECFFMTKDGLVFERTEKMTDKIIFRGILEGNPLMRSFATPAKIQNYLNLIEVLNNSGFGVGSINIESSDRAVAKSIIGDIIFNPEEANLASVGQNVVLLINEVMGKNSSAVFNYIDARFGNKIFYKLL